jgi:hypothetical protein
LRPDSDFSVLAHSIPQSSSEGEFTKLAKRCTSLELAAIKAQMRLASASSLYVYVFSPPTCESQYVVGSVKNSPCLQRGRIASSLTLMPRPGPVGTGM